MFLEEFVTTTADSACFSASQASRFAKEVAGDFNPLHDPQARRFCVPGDLLFALVLAKYGISEKMSFTFTGMLGDGATVNFPDGAKANLSITDGSGRSCLQVEREGATSKNEALIEHFIRQYVAFSGQSFPHILVPLLAKHGVMLNPDRPMVIYQSMAFELDRLDFSHAELSLTASSLALNGKRGDARLDFQIRASGENIGTGSKQLVIGGLLEYDPALVQQLIEQYGDRISGYQSKT